jgi:hypothetical protein
MDNRAAYARAPAIHLELGAEDPHVPPAGALAFQEALRREHPAAARAITTVMNEGCNHLSLVQRRAVAARSVDFLIGRG